MDIDKPYPVAALQCPPVTALEAQAIFIAAGYGIWLLAGHPFGNIDAFRYARTLDEWAWSITLLIGALLYFIGVVLWRCWVRQLGLTTIGVVWLAMAVCIACADPRLPGIWLLSVLCGSAILSAFRLFR